MLIKEKHTYTKHVSTKCDVILLFANFYHIFFVIFRIHAQLSEQTHTHPRTFVPIFITKKTFSLKNLKYLLS